MILGRFFRTLKSLTVRRTVLKSYIRWNVLLSRKTVLGTFIMGRKPDFTGLFLMGPFQVEHPVYLQDNIKVSTVLLVHLSRAKYRVKKYA
jgi:hypothetical protein